MKWASVASVFVLSTVLGCTIKVEPLPKKKAVVVKHVHHYHSKPKPKASATPTETLQSKKFPVPEQPQDRLIGHPEPEATP